MITWTKIVRLQHFFTLIIESIGHRQVFFPTLPISCTYFTLRNCRDLNICKKIKQNHENFTGKWYWFKIDLSKRYGAWRTLSEFPDNDWKVGSINSLLNRIRKTDTTVRQPGSNRLRSSCSSWKPCAESGRQAKKAPISSWDFAWNCYYLSKCAQDNSPWSPAQMLQMTSFSAVVWSQSHLSSHSLINNLIACNKSCYCSIINCKLNNK